MLEGSTHGSENTQSTGLTKPKEFDLRPVVGYQQKLWTTCLEFLLCGDMDMVFQVLRVIDGRHFYATGIFWDV